MASASVLLLLAPLFASAMGLPILKAPPAHVLPGIIQHLAGQVASATTAAATPLSSAGIEIVSLAYAACVVASALFLVVVAVCYAPARDEDGKNVLGTPMPPH